MPEPKTAIVLPSAESAPLWAAESQPLAMPLTMTIPAEARSLETASAIESPYVEARLVPTTAIEIPLDSPVKTPFE